MKRQILFAEVCGQGKLRVIGLDHSALDPLFKSFILEVNQYTIQDFDFTMCQFKPGAKELFERLVSTLKIKVVHYG